MDGTSPGDRPQIGLRELRDSLGTWVERAQAGEEIIITDRGKPVARLMPYETNLERMIRQGLVRPATEPPKPLEELGLPIKLNWGTVSDLIQRR